MNTLDKRTYQNRVAASLKDSRESLFGKPLLDFLAYETPFLKAQFHEEESRFHWEVAVPGLTKESVTVRIEGRSMLVMAQEKKPRTGGFNRTLFHHTFRVPSAANVKTAAATCRHGVLKISIAKVRPKQFHRTIPVRGENTFTRLAPVVAFRNRIRERVARVWGSLVNPGSANALKRSITKDSFQISQ